MNNKHPISCHCTKCTTITGRLWSDMVLILGFCGAMTTMLALAYYEVISLIYGYISMSAFGIIVLVSAIINATPLGNRIRQKYPRLFSTD